MAGLGGRLVLQFRDCLQASDPPVGGGDERCSAWGRSKRKTPARKRDWGSLIEHGGDVVLDQRTAAYYRRLGGANYKLAMVTDKASQVEFFYGFVG